MKFENEAYIACISNVTNKLCWSSLSIAYQLSCKLRVLHIVNISHNHCSHNWLLMLHFSFTIVFLNANKKKNENGICERSTYCTIFPFLQCIVGLWYYYNIFDSVFLFSNILFHLFLSVTFNLIFNYYSRYLLMCTCTCIININNFRTHWTME